VKTKNSVLFASLYMLAGITLIIGKLAGLIAASWVLVLAPVWFPYAVALLFVAAMLTVAVLG
jgi:hypothetical protein